MKKQKHNTSKWRKMFEKRIKGNPLRELLRFFAVNNDFHMLIRNIFPKKTIFVEFGAGTAFHSFCFCIYGYNTIATDVDDQVVDLIKKTRKSLGLDLAVKKLDILNNKISKKGKGVMVTFSDGLLEHFSIPEIKKALSNQKNADYITFAVPTKHASKDSLCYGDENLYPTSTWIKISKQAFPKSKITVYPIYF